MLQLWQYQSIDNGFRGEQDRGQLIVRYRSVSRSFINDFPSSLVLPESELFSLFQLDRLPDEVLEVTYKAFAVQPLRMLVGSTWNNLSPGRE